MGDGLSAGTSKCAVKRRKAERKILAEDDGVRRRRLRVTRHHVMIGDGIWNCEDGMMGDDDTEPVHGERRVESVDVAGI